MKLDVYYSDDYAGLELDDIQFYFGYEETKCKKHKNNCGCEDSEWAFTVIKGKRQKLLMKLSQSEIDEKISYQSPKDFVDEPYGYLLAGIGIYLKRNLK